MIERAALLWCRFFAEGIFNLREMKGHTMKKVVVGLVLALTVAACSAPTTEPANTMVTPEATSQKL